MCPGGRVVTAQVAAHGHDFATTAVTAGKSAGNGGVHGVDVVGLTRRACGSWRRR